MNPKVFFGLALVGCVFSTASAILSELAFTSAAAGAGTALTTTLTGGAATTAATTVFFTPAGAALLAGGALLGKAAILVAAAETGSRLFKRSTEAEELIAEAAALEPAQCYRRLVCDLATGTMPKSENLALLNLFNKPASIDSPRFDFNTAAAVGKQARSVSLCEVRYSCPLTGAQIDKLFA